MRKFIKTFESLSGIEKKPRLSEKMIGMLNDQIRSELESSQLYRSMAFWLDDEGWSGACKYFLKSSDEELVHMRKIHDYLFVKNCRAVAPKTEEPAQDFEGIRDILEKSLDHEFKITEDWKKIADAAVTENDHDTYELALWFAKEQGRDEESRFRDLLFKLDREMPEWKIDELMESL